MSVLSRASSTIMFALASFVTLLLATTPQSILAGEAATSVPLRFMSYNVRYDSQPDSISVQQSIDSLPSGLPAEPVYYSNATEQPWSLRRLYIANDVLFNRANILGGQELLKRQVDDMSILLGDRYGWIGIGRDDGKEAGEYEAIFYDTHKITVNEWDTFWLSETPFEPSKYPDAGSYRTATTAHVTRTESGGNLTIINTHLDDQSAAQRSLGMSLVLRRAKYEAIKTGGPVILTGDFNSPPSDGAYQIITGAEEPFAINQTFADRYNWTTTEEAGFKDFAMQDLLGQVSPRYRIGGNYATFTDFLPVGNASEFSRIDYIMAGNHGGWKALTYKVEDNVGDDGVLHSDHRPVFADIAFDNA